MLNAFLNNFKIFVDKTIILCYNYFVVKGKINNLTENKKTNIKEKIL